MTMVERLLALADDLAAKSDRSLNAPTASRQHRVLRACFTRWPELCADELLGSETGKRSEEYVRIYRSLEHGTLKTAFGAPPLNGVDALQKIGNRSRSCFRANGSARIIFRSSRCTRSTRPPTWLSLPKSAISLDRHSFRAANDERSPSRSCSRTVHNEIHPLLAERPPRHLGLARRDRRRADPRRPRGRVGRGPGAQVRRLRRRFRHRGEAASQRRPAEGLHRRRRRRSGAGRLRRAERAHGA